MASSNQTGRGRGKVRPFQYALGVVSAVRGWNTEVRGGLFSVGAIDAEVPFEVAVGRPSSAHDEAVFSFRYDAEIPFLIVRVRFRHWGVEGISVKPLSFVHFNVVAFVCVPPGKEAALDTADLVAYLSDDDSETHVVAGEDAPAVRTEQQTTF